MNILFLTLLDISDKNQNPIYTDLVNHFHKENHNIYVVCPVEKRKNQNTTLLDNNGVKILKIKIGNITKAGIVEKGISTLLIENQYLKGIKEFFANVKFDLVLYSTPPITFEKVVRYIKERDNAKTYLLLKDIFPQNAVDLGMFSKKSLFYKFFRNKEKRLYQQSDYIGCMSQANVDFVIKHNNFIDSSKVEVCPNSIEPKPIMFDKTKKEEIRLKYNIPLDKTVFVYGGNLGKPQGIDFLINCLKSNKDNQKAFFLIIGSGTKFNKIKTFLEMESISNTKLISYLPKEDYELLVTSCDVGLVFLDYRFTIPNFPSRILSYMQAQMPVLAATDKNTDLGEIIETNEFGYWCESVDINDFNKYLNALSSNPKLLEKMGNNARRYLENHCTVKKSYEILMRHFEEEIINV